MTYYCGECKKECSVHAEDFGIGPGEFWGASFNDVKMELVSDCCDGEVYVDEELTEFADYWEWSRDEEDYRADWLYERMRDEEGERRWNGDG